MSDPVDHAAAPEPLDAPPRLSDRVLAAADRYRYLIFVGIVLLYAAGFNAQWRIEPDSGLYLSIGRNLVEGNGYTYLGKDHRLAYPGLPLLFAGVFKVFGTGSVLPHLVLMWFAGLACLGLVYRLFLLHAGRPTAVLITLGVAISRVFYRYSFELLTDLPFLLGVMAFFVGYEALFYRRSRKDEPADGEAATDDAPGEESRGRTKAVWFDGVLLVAGLGLAVAARPSMWALVVAAGMALAWSVLRGRARWGHVAVAGLVVLAVALFYWSDPRQPVAGSTRPVSTNYVEEDQLFHLRADKLGRMAALARQNLADSLDVGLAKATFSMSLARPVDVALGALIAVAGLMLVRTRPLWGMWVLATLLMVTQVRPVDRYFLPVLPVLVYGWWLLVRRVEGWIPNRRAAAAAFLALFALGAVPNLGEVFGFIFEQRQVPFLSYYKKGRYASADDVAHMLASSTPPSRSQSDASTTWVLVPEKFARAMTFLSRRYCVEPDVGTQLDPAGNPGENKPPQLVYVLEPTELPGEAPDAKRPPVKSWLETRGAEVDPAVVATVPNKMPRPKNDPTPIPPWTLHHTVRLGTTATRPASAPATVPAVAP